MVFRLTPLKTSLFLSLFLALGITAFAQRADDEDKSEAKAPLGKYEQQEFCKKTGDQIFDDMRVKQCIKEQQRQFNELLENGQEAANLGEELEKSFEKSSTLSIEDQKKLERLEKLTKKIRTSLGGEDDEDTGNADDDKPMTLKDAVGELSTRAAGLFDELKKTTRYSISVVAIQSTNSVIKLVKYIRFSKK
jgi:hypothetical protein